MCPNLTDFSHSFFFVQIFILESAKMLSVKKMAPAKCSVSDCTSENDSHSSIPDWKIIYYKFL